MALLRFLLFSFLCTLFGKWAGFLAVFCYDTLLTQADDISSFFVNSVPVSRGLCRGGLGH